MVGGGSGRRAFNRAHQGGLWTLTQGSKTVGPYVSGMDRFRPAVTGDCSSIRPSRGRLEGTTKGVIESLYDRLCRSPPEEGGRLKDEPSGVASNGTIAVEPEVVDGGLGSGG